MGFPPRAHYPARGAPCARRSHRDLTCPRTRFRPCRLEDDDDVTVFAIEDDRL